MADTLKEDVDISTLAKRLQHLEALTAAKNESLELLRRRKTNQPPDSLLGVLTSINAKLQSIKDEKRSIGEFLTKHDQLQDLLDDPQADTDGELDAAAKKEIVLAAEDDLLHWSEQLEEFVNVKDELESQRIAEAYSRANDLLAIRNTQTADVEVVSSLNEQVQQLLEFHNKYVSEQMMRAL
ncbi:hypothetical protein BJ742DRAFT_769573 [Cladochytrium replicatum]|nr:hypothetical protein BJ742DRAFT_769573 [Cladochytrium replicatum]